ncbi:reverse transcriptase domain-containing protein [uncultured Phocaeicola sp.]|uniref:reverse transcriptase domain-containing protein n=1 Tax=uncultured Phocaeicola sp. TaxID=990718 RepID=UPI0025EC5A9D|nr:reverse transcriptase domain-containing protein [uncultured Phocaeicola sp.]
MRKQEATSGMYPLIGMLRPALIFFIMQADWLKFKKYPHIGKPLTNSKDRVWVENYVTNPHNIIRHKFVPLLHRVLTQRKFRPNESSVKNLSGKRKRFDKGRKERHIFYPSHLDSIIFSYYNSILTQAYEKYLSDKDYASVAVAYRKIPKNDMDEGNKCNIEFAADAFQFIINNKQRKLSVIVADVTSFFDNLNHRLLHTQWKKVLNVEDLPADHYTIYKNLVDYKYVNENELFKRFRHKLIVERYKPNDTSSIELKRKSVNKIYHMRQEKVVAYCYADEFFREATDLIRVDKPFNKTIREKQGKQNKKGIPQGTPISATLANIYMLDFDAKVYKETSNRNAYYQRYSDDLIIVCDQKDEIFFYDLIREEIEKKAYLDIQESKTHIYRYELDLNNTLIGGIVKGGIVQTNKQLEYLGFVFDRGKVRVKSSGFSKFYRKMKRSFRRGIHFAKKAHIPSNSLFEGRLYKRFTHVGAKRRLKWIADSTSPTGYKRTTIYDWGNFISYLNKANSVMFKINKDNNIAKQYRKVWNKFHILKKQAYKEIKK